jgi:peptidoglycan hydrolase CwlO-like protein
MQMLKRIILVMTIGILCVPGTLAAHAQTKTQALHNVEQELQQKAQEKQAVNKDIAAIQQEMQSISTYIAKNKDQLAETQAKIDQTNQLIEQKKQEIVTLEDKIQNRKNVMKKRLVALQHDDNLNLYIKVLLDAKDFNDFIQRASAVTSLFNADKDILNAQQEDLGQIEKDKKDIDNQQQVLLSEQQNLADQQEQLDLNLQKRQQSLTALQQKYTQIATAMTAAAKEKATIEQQIKAAQEALLREQAEARARAAAARAASTPASVSAPVSVKGQEMYVTATAYTPFDSGSITRLGYNIKANPNMKLIAVDPSVIPLGSKVWVEGYGVAIAGDTGGAINGHRIDVLKPTVAQARAWGVRTVKVVILD